MQTQTLALIAHDSKKEDMIDLLKAHKTDFEEIDLVATRSTGLLIQSRVGLPIELVNSGPHGGDQQIGALVANGVVSAVIFLRDPLQAQAHEPDISALLRVCDVHNVPLATNVASGEALLHLIFEHPEALSGHHIVAGYLDEIAATDN